MAGLALGVSGAASPVGDTDATLHAAQWGSPEGRSCRPRVVWTTGRQSGDVSQDLLVPGNVNCVEGPFGGTLEVGVELCDGRPATLRGITVEKRAYANGREWTFGANMYYQFVYDNDSRSPPLSLNRGNRIRSVSFPPQRVSRIVIGLQVPRTRAYRIDQYICSMQFQMD